MTTIVESNLQAIPSEPSTIAFAQLNPLTPRRTVANEQRTVSDERQDGAELDRNAPSTMYQRRPPLPTRLSFEQNLTNMIEKESPLLQSELLTAEHELSVLRSRLAVNEGVTAVTGSILKSLKDQFEPHRMVDSATSPLDIYKINLSQRSSSIQTSPTVEAYPDFPESVEIHYDGQSPKSPYLVVKAKNSFWIARTIPTSEAKTHLEKFTSPVMKRATLKLPNAFDQRFLIDSDAEDEPRIEDTVQLSSQTPMEQRSSAHEPLTEANLERLSNEHIDRLARKETSWSTEVLAPSIGDESLSRAHPGVTHQSSLADSSTNRTDKDERESSISPEDDRAFPDTKEQIAEMKTIRSSSLLPIEDQFEPLDDKIDEIYADIDHLKTNKLTLGNINNIQRKIADLKTIMADIQLSKQDELRIEYELDELERLFITIDENLATKINQQEDYSLVQLFEQNVNELRRIIDDMKSMRSHPPALTSIISDEASVPNESSSLPPMAVAGSAAAATDWSAEQMAEYFQRSPTGQLLSSTSRLVPEDPVITRDVFFEGDKSMLERKKSSTPLQPLIPEDAQINAENFYEGDIHRSLYEHKPEATSHEPPLIPESPLISGEVFYEGDPQRSMFSAGPSASRTDPPAIDNLRTIMSDLMLAASWSKKPSRTEDQPVDSKDEDDEEILAESFITTEERSSTASLCEIVHEIENFPLSASRLPITIEERDNISPFSTETPIVIHRNILTRQETDRWPQEESLIISGSVDEEEPTLASSLTTSGAAEDWMHSSHQRKEVYGEQYRPERRFSTEEHPAAVENNVHHEPELQSANEEENQYHIERTWSTDKILDPSSTIDEEAKYEDADESTIQADDDKPRVPEVTLISHQSPLTEQDEDQYELASADVEEPLRSEKRDSAEQVVSLPPQTIASMEYQADQPRASSIASSASHQDIEQQSPDQEDDNTSFGSSSDKTIIENRQFTQSKQDEHDETLTQHEGQADVDQEPGRDDQHGDEGERADETEQYLQKWTKSLDQFEIKPFETHEQDQLSSVLQTQQNLIQTSDESMQHERERKPSVDRVSSAHDEAQDEELDEHDIALQASPILTSYSDREQSTAQQVSATSAESLVARSPQPSAHDEISQPPLDSNRRRSSERSPTASPTILEREDEQLVTLDDASRTSHQEPTQDAVAETSEAKLEREISTEELATRLSHESKEEQYSPERKLSTDEPVLKSSPTVEKTLEDSHSSFEHAAVASNDDIEEEHQEVDEQSSLKQSLTSEELNNESLRLSEHDDAPEDEPVMKSSPTVEKTLEDSHSSFEHATGVSNEDIIEEHRQVNEQSPRLSAKDDEGDDVHQDVLEDEVQQSPSRKFSTDEPVLKSSPTVESSHPHASSVLTSLF